MPFELAIAAALVGGGTVLGSLVVWVLAGQTRGAESRAAAMREAETARLLEEAREALDRERGRLEALQGTLSDKRVEIANLETTLTAERKAHAEKTEELKNVRQQIEKDLQVMMNQLLETSSKSFLERAGEVFKTQQEKGETGLKTLMGPLKEELEKFQRQVDAMEKARKQDEGQLIRQLHDISESHTKLNQTTNSLVNALRSAPKTRGRWGEEQLRTLLEMAGMSEHVDFGTEQHFATEDGARRPDVILTMPGGRTLVIDAKTSLSAYLEAMEAETDEAREAKLVEHARQIRTHVDQLGRKEYWRTLPADTVDFVVMFVPGEPMYAAAMARDPGLFQDAWDKKVIVCSPTTLLGLAKAIAYGWRQEKASKEAQRIHEVATELYRRLVKLGGDVAGMTKSLNAHVEKHNKLVASLEGRVLPQARKMTELSVGEQHGEIAELEPVEHEVRAPLPDKDMDVPQQGLLPERGEP